MGVQWRPAQREILAILRFLVVYSACIAQTAAQCNNPAPGVSKMIRGVDITELDLMPLDLRGVRGFKSPILDFTCDMGNGWTEDGVQYQLPDQVWHMTTVPGGWLTTDVLLYKSASDVRTSMTRNVGGEGSIWKFSFSASRSYSSMQHTISNMSRYISDTSSFDSASRVDLLPDWALSLNPYALMYIQRFINTDTYSNNPEAYQKFIDYFGTHYFSVAKFGGYIRVLENINTNYFKSHSEGEAKSNAQASFLSFLSAHGGTVSGSTSVDSEFTSNTEQTITYYGGTTNLLITDGIQSWQPTVDGDPWLFSGQLTSISNLLQDEAQRQSMETAVLQHLMRSYLGEIRRTLITMVTRFGNDATLSEIEGRLAAMEVIALGGLVQPDVEKLSEDVKRHIEYLHHEHVTPDWFNLNTQLCFKWWPDGDGGQCGGGAARLLCAKPGAMSPVYRDDTDRRGGGCRMQWSIQSSGYESWFNQVQVCYRWHPDGDGGQCGGGAARLLCAGVNNYTPNYRDDTDRRSGGCQMSWRIVVPDSAPQWAKKVKLCFSWYPDGDGGQCGGSAPSRNLCATANEWTAYYRDDTDRRGGGCRMSWGLRL